MKRQLTTAALAVLTALCAFAVVAGPSIARAGVSGPPVNPDIVVSIESPKNDVAGVTAVQGFAFASNGIDRVEWVLDGTPMGRLPHGGSRGDVRDAYPSYPKSETENSGFSATWFMGLLTPGAHEIIVNAYDTNGGVNSDSANFTTYKFERFIKQDEMLLQNLVIRDVRTHSNSDYLYDVELSWSQAGQTWEITKITESCDESGGGGLCLTPFPQAPTNVIASEQGVLLSRYVQIEWVAPSDISDVTYEIQRRQIHGQIVDSWVVAGFAPANATSFKDFGAAVLGNPVYEYRVRGMNGGGVSDWSSTVTFPAPPPGPIFP